MDPRTATSGHKPLVALDALRGVAAFAVVMGHVRAQTLLGQGHNEQGDGWQTWALVPTGFAAEAVAVFFVLSGFLVGGQVVKNVRAGTFTWGEYVARRVSRLYVVLLPALVFTMVLDSVTASLFAGNVAAQRARAVPSLADLACNVAFLQDSRCKSFGTNGSLWSLSYEFWFYVLFAAACAAYALAARRRAVAATLNACLCIAVVALFGVHLLELIPAWLIGVGLALWQEWRSNKKTTKPVRVTSILAAVLVLIVTSGITTLTGVAEPVEFAVVGLAATPLANLTTRPSRVWSSWIVRRLGWLGGWSYTLYAFHRPIVAFVAAGLGTSVELSRVEECFIIYFASVAIAGICFPAFFLGEAHTARVRSWLQRRIGQSAPTRIVRAVEVRDSAESGLKPTTPEASPL